MIKCCCFLVFLVFSVYSQDLSCLTGNSTVCNFGVGIFSLTLPAGVGISEKIIYAETLTLVGATPVQPVAFLDTTFIISGSLYMTDIIPAFQNVAIEAPFVSLTETTNSISDFMKVFDTNITYSDTLVLDYYSISTRNALFNGINTGRLQLSAGGTTF